MEREMNITSVLDELLFYTYPGQVSATQGVILRIDLKPATLYRLTEELYKPRCIENDSQRIIQEVAGMIVRQEEQGVYIFIGYINTLNYFIRTFYNNSMLVSKSFVSDAVRDENETGFEQNDYSIPFSGRRNYDECDEESMETYRMECFNAYINEVWNFSSRSRGEYYCCFNEGNKLLAASRTKLHDLKTISDDLDLYTREALLCMFAATGINIEKFLRGEYILNHTTTTYFQCCVRNKTSIFHKVYRGRDDDPLYDVEFINSSIPAPFSLSAYKPDAYRKNSNTLFFNTFVDGSSETDADKKTVPCQKPLWVKHFIGYGKNFPGDTKHDWSTEREYGSLELYLVDLMTKVVMCSDKEYLIDMLAMQSSDVRHVARIINELWTNKTVQYRQYTIDWPERYASVTELASDLFGRMTNYAELLYLLTFIPSPSSTSPLPVVDVRLIRGFIRKLYDNNTLVRIVKEKVEKQLAQGEYTYVREGGNGRIILSQYENYMIWKKCCAMISKTLKGELYRVKFACDVEKDILKVIPSTMSIFISSTQEKIVKFIYSLVIQREKDGMLNLAEAFKNTTIVNPASEYANEISVNKKRFAEAENEEMLKRMAYLERIVNLDRTSPIYRVRIPNALLEKIILYIEFRKNVEISLTEIEEYAELLNKKTDEFSCSVPSTFGITVESDVSDNIVVRSDLLEEVFYIPSSFKLIPNEQEADIMKPIDDFNVTNVMKFRGNINKQRLHTLFSLCGLDYYFYQTQELSDVGRSSYLLRLYKALVNDNGKSINLGFLTASEADNDDLITYECNEEDFDWKPSTMFS